MPFTIFLLLIWWSLLSEGTIGEQNKNLLEELDPICENPENNHMQSSMRQVNTTNFWMFPENQRQIRKRNAVENNDLIWNVFHGAPLHPDKYVIPYRFNDIFWLDHQRLIQSVMRRIEMNSCLLFKEIQNAAELAYYQPNYVEIRNYSGAGCKSVVGRVQKVAFVNLEDRKIKSCMNERTITHELFHLIGFYHEHKSLIRDGNVIVQEHNIKEGKEKNFHIKAQSRNFGLKYDFLSIMHYRSNSFSIARNENTLETVDPIHQNVIGRLPAASDIDYLKVNILYDCVGVMEKIYNYNATQAASVTQATDAIKTPTLANFAQRNVLKKRLDARPMFLAVATTNTDPHYQDNARVLRELLRPKTQRRIERERIEWTGKQPEFNKRKQNVTKKKLNKNSDFVKTETSTNQSTLLRQSIDANPKSTSNDARRIHGFKAATGLLSNSLKKDSKRRRHKKNITIVQRQKSLRKERSRHRFRKGKRTKKTKLNKSISKMPIMSIATPKESLTGVSNGNEANPKPKIVASPSPEKQRLKTSLSAANSFPKINISESRPSKQKLKKTKPSNKQRKAKKTYSKQKSKRRRNSLNDSLQNLRTGKSSLLSRRSHRHSKRRDSKRGEARDIKAITTAKEPLKEVKVDIPEGQSILKIEDLMNSTKQTKKNNIPIMSIATSKGSLTGVSNGNKATNPKSKIVSSLNPGKQRFQTSSSASNSETRKRRVNKKKHHRRPSPMTPKTSFKVEAFSKQQNETNTFMQYRPEVLDLSKELSMMTLETTPRQSLNSMLIKAVDEVEKRRKASSPSTTTPSKHQRGRSRKKRKRGLRTHRKPRNESKILNQNPGDIQKPTKSPPDGDSVPVSTPNNNNTFSASLSPLANNTMSKKVNTPV